MSHKSSFPPPQVLMRIQANPAHTSTIKTRPTPKQRSVFLLQNAELARAYLF